MRRYDEQVAVRFTEGGDGPSERAPERGAPHSFVWRGRPYVVHAVVDRWIQRRPWWRRALEPQGAVSVSPGSGSAGSAVALLADLEDELWRVEAAIGRVGRVGDRPGYGVYDLVRTGPDQWRLLAVVD